MLPDPLLPDPRLLSRVFVDNLTFAFREPGEFVERSLLELFADHWADFQCPWDGDDVAFTRSDKAGNFGEERKWTIRGLPLFRLFAAGQSTAGVGRVIIDGTSCRLVRPEFWPGIAEVGEPRLWVPKRIDAAVDDDTGLLSVDVLQALYEARQLQARGPGRPRLFDPRDPRRGNASTGWTVYVGKRSGQFAYDRIYAKWFEVLAKLGSAGVSGIPECRVRLEVEWKDVKNGPPLTWAMVTNPAPFFAANSPLFESRAVGVTPVRIGRVVRDQQEAAMMKMLMLARNAFGPIFEQAHWAFGGDDAADVHIMDIVRRTGKGSPIVGVAEVAGGGKPDKEFVYER